MPNQFTASIWGDEGFSAILSMKSIPEIIAIVARDTSPPLYNVTEHIWFRLFGTSEVAIRSLSFLYYLICAFFAYKIGEYLWNKKTGILSAALTFFNPFFFIYAFEGRMYSILALGVTASMYFFLRLTLDKKPTKLLLAGYIISTLWALYSHHFSIFALFIQGSWFLFLAVKYLLTKKAKKQSKTVLLTLLRGLILVAILYSPWIIPLYNQTTMVGSGFWLGKPSAGDLRELIYRYLGQGQPHMLSKYALYTALTGLAARAWEKDIKKSIFLISWFLVPILSTWAISQVFSPIFFDRYLIISIPAGMLLLGSEQRKKLLKLIPALALVLFLIIDTHYFTNPTKAPFREFSKIVKSELREGDYLINWNAGYFHLWESKYYGIPGPIYVAEGDLPFFVGTALMEEGDITRNIPENVTRVGVITRGNPEEVIFEGFEQVAITQLDVLKLVWLKRSL